MRKIFNAYTDNCIDKCKDEGGWEKENLTLANARAHREAFVY